MSEEHKSSENNRKLSDDTFIRIEDGKQFLYHNGQKVRDLPEVNVNKNPLGFMLSVSWPVVSEKELMTGYLYREIDEATTALEVDEIIGAWFKFIPKTMLIGGGHLKLDWEKQAAVFKRMGKLGEAKVLEYAMERRRMLLISQYRGL